MSSQGSVEDSEKRHVVIVRHQPDYRDPGGTVWQRFQKLRQAPVCLFLNPLATITCSVECDDFYRAVEQHRCLWWKLFKRCRGRRCCRGVEEWAVGRPQLTWAEAIVDYRFGYQGALFVNFKLRKKPTYLHPAILTEQT